MYNVFFHLFISHSFYFTSYNVITTKPYLYPCENRPPIFMPLQLQAKRWKQKGKEPESLSSHTGDLGLSTTLRFATSNSPICVREIRFRDISCIFTHVGSMLGL